MGITDKFPGSRRLRSTIDAVTGAEWRFHSHYTKLLKPDDVAALEEWILTRPYSGLLAVSNGPLRVVDVQGDADDLRIGGTNLTITSQNTLLKETAETETVYTLERDQDPDRSIYIFGSDKTTVKVLGRVRTFPVSIGGSLSFHYPEVDSRIELDVNAQVTSGIHAREVNMGLALSGINVEEAADGIVETILVTFRDFSGQNR